MDLFRKLLIILIVLFILPAGLYAVTGSSDPVAPEDAAVETDEGVSPEGDGPPSEGEGEAPPEAEPGGFAVAVDLRLGGVSIGFAPALSAVVGVPMLLSTDSVSLAPLVGFMYFFDIWTDVHSTFYIPVGIEAVYYPYNLNLKVMYYPPVAATDGIHLLSVTGGAELMMFEAGGFSMNLDFGIGPMFVLDPDGLGVILSINSALIMRYRI